MRKFLKFAQDLLHGHLFLRDWEMARLCSDARGHCTGTLQLASAWLSSLVDPIWRFFWLCSGTRLQLERDPLCGQRHPHPSERPLCQGLHTDLRSGADGPALTVLPAHWRKEAGRTGKPLGPGADCGLKRSSSVCREKLGRVDRA